MGHILRVTALTSAPPRGCDEEQTLATEEAKWIDQTHFFLVK
jgi:hypothetical protein